MATELFKQWPQTLMSQINASIQNSLLSVMDFISVNPTRVAKYLLCLDIAAQIL
jgi:hypothetical protein